MYGLPEAQFDFEAVAVEQDDFQRLQSQIGGHQEDRAAQRMTNDDEAHQPSRRPPQEIDRAIAQRNILLAVDGAGCGEKLVLVAGQILELHFFAVEPWPSAAAAPRRRRRPIGHGVGLGASHELMSLAE